MQTSIKKDLDNYPRGNIFNSSALSKGYFYNNQQQLQHQTSYITDPEKQPASQQQLYQAPQSTRRRSKPQNTTPQKTEQTFQNLDDISPNKATKAYHRRTKKKNTNTKKRQQLQHQLQTLDEKELQNNDIIMLSKESSRTNRQTKENQQEVFQLDDLESKDQFHLKSKPQNLTESNQTNQQNQQSNLEKVRKQIVFQQSSDDDEQRSQSPQRLQPLQLAPKTSSTPLFPQKQTSAKNTSKFEQSQQTPQKIQIPQQHFLKILTLPVKKNMVMRTNVERVNGFLFNTYPEYHVYFEADKTHLISAKRVSRTPYSTFIISRNKNDFVQNSQNYLGKAKGSVLGDELNLFGTGLSPANALVEKVKPRQLIASIVYETRIILAGQPRNFSVYIKKPQVDYYQSFPQVKIYGQQIPLHLLYQNPHNRDKIMVFKNKKPEYQAQTRGYSLNFRGRVGIASVKNFLLQKVPDSSGKQQQNQAKQNTEKDPQLDIMIFGKVKDNFFNMDMSYPLSPLIALGIGLSSFDQKYFCQ